MKWILTALLILSSRPAAAQTQTAEIIHKDEVLTIQKCVEIGIKHHPSIAASRSVVQANTERIGQAESGLYPQVDLSGGYSRVDPSAAAPGSPGSSKSFNQYSASLNLHQLLYDSGKTSTVANIEKVNRDATVSDLANVQEQIIFKIKQAYFNLLRAKKNLDVAIDTVKKFEKHLEQAKGFFDVGTKPRFDVTKAEVDLSNAKLGLISAQNSLRNARVVLNNAMGVPEAPPYGVEDNLSFDKFDITQEQAVATAYDKRYDLKALIKRRRVAEQAVDLARKESAPRVTGNASISTAGDDFPLDDGWSLGVSVTVPVFNGYLTGHKEAEAKANLETSMAKEQELKQAIVLEIQQSMLNLVESQERISTAELTVRQATENHEIATGRYTAGVGSPIEVTDAEVSLSSAKISHISALYDYKVARLSLERAMGMAGVSHE